MVVPVERLLREVERCSGFIGEYLAALVFSAFAAELSAPGIGPGLGEGEVAKKEYEEYSEWCADRSKNLGFEIKTGKSEIAELQATIGAKTLFLCH